jgi:hypothetical protein
MKMINRRLSKLEATSKPAEQDVKLAIIMDGQSEAEAHELSDWSALPIERLTFLTEAEWQFLTEHNHRKMGSSEVEAARSAWEWIDKLRRQQEAIRAGDINAAPYPDWFWPPTPGSYPRVRADIRKRMNNGMQKLEPKP